MTYKRHVPIKSRLCNRQNFLKFLFSPSGSSTVHQASVVEKVDSAIHWINLYPLDNVIIITLILIHWIVIYLVDSAIQLLNNWGQDLIMVKQKISPGAYIFQRPFLGGIYTEEICISKSIGLTSSLEGNLSQ